MDRTYHIRRMRVPAEGPLKRTYHLRRTGVSAEGHDVISLLAVLVIALVITDILLTRVF